MRTISRLCLLVILLAVGTWQPAPAESAPSAAAPFRVYLTFEDGPTTWYTPGIMDILARYNAKATFFVNGDQLAGKEAVVQRMVAEGHAVGNHLWTEVGHYYGYPDADIQASYDRTEAAIRAALTPDLLNTYLAQPRLFRWPGGGGSPFPSRPTDEPMITYNWHVSGNDCGSNISFESDVSFDAQVIRNVIGQPNPAGVPYWNVFDHGDGVVIVLHDINRVTERVLPPIMDTLVAAGATFHALPRPEDAANTMPVVLGAAPYRGNGINGASFDATANGTIRVRTGPSLDAATLIGNIPDGTQLPLVGRNASATWYMVSVEGQIGWVSATVVNARGPIPQLPLTG